MLVFFLPALFAVAMAVENPKQPEFQQRLEEYQNLRQKVTSRIPKLKKDSTAAQITEHKNQLEAAITAARVNAKQGSIFTPSVQHYFLAIIRSEMKGPGTAAARKTAKDGNPASEGDTSKVELKVNGSYADDQPLSTMPPALLQRLPKIPEYLSYRFVGRTFILFDSGTGLIVDLIPQAIPAQ